MWKEFKEFAIKGNAVDLAVGVVIGAAFGKIVGSLVADVIMPPIGVLTGGVDFKDYFVVLKPLGAHYQTLKEAAEAKAVTLNLGQFVNTVIEFLIIAFSIFLVVKALNEMKRPKPDAPAVAKDCPMCTKSIPINAKRCPECTAQLSPA
ncbi:MAG TPA: large-conductance mechanosensitive channel protein MscL [Chthoniobacterales bacterium]|nr:large-conductance mechanosensitive channel protein MscL [Chthoniobacterales bacterium]